MKESLTRELLLSSKFILYVPKIVFNEIFSHLDELCSRSKLTKNDLLTILNILLEHIIVVEENLYEDLLIKAYNICKQFDAKDAPFIALAMKLKIPIWSNDKDLQTKQKVVKVYNTQEIINLPKSA